MQLTTLVSKISTRKLQCCKTLAWQNNHPIKSDPVQAMSELTQVIAKHVFCKYRVSEINCELISEFPGNRRKILRLFLLK